MCSRHTNGCVVVDKELHKAVNKHVPRNFPQRKNAHGMLYEEGGGNADEAKEEDVKKQGENISAKQVSLGTVFGFCGIK